MNESAPAMDFSNLDRNRVLIGGIAAIVLIISVLFLPWYSLDLSPQRVEGQPNADTWLCGTDDQACTAFDIFPILGPLLLLTAIAPLILAYILVRGHKLSWAPGELTMVVGFTAMVLVAYNGIIDKPGKGIGEVGVSLDWGYWIGLLAATTIAMVGFMRSLESGGRQKRKAPGTV